MAFRGFLNLSRTVNKNLFTRITPQTSKNVFCQVKANFTTKSKRSFSVTKISILSASGGALIGVGYSAYTHYDINKNKMTKNATEDEPTLLKELPHYVPTKKVKGKLDLDLNIVLFQYQTCPFCCKVRAFLDYHGFSYDIVEVDAVLRQSIKWSKYRKVPIVLVKTSDGYQQLNDSTVIISVLSTYLLSKNQDVTAISKFYPSITYEDEDGKTKNEVLNKYFVMHQEGVSSKLSDRLSEERVWRKWSDNVLVHTLSPNVYRTLDEAFQAFNWFAEVGEWRKHFPEWEVKLMINVGAYVMYLIGKRLKKKHGLKEDVRQSLYDECYNWTKYLKNKGTDYMGGSSPDLSDLAVYGVLSSIEGCDAFKDILENTNIKNWYYRMKNHTAHEALQAA